MTVQPLPTPPAPDGPAGAGRPLARAHDDFRASGRIAPAVRPLVAGSWQRSAAAGVDGVLLPPVRMAVDELADYRRAHPLATAGPLLADLLGAPAGGADYVYAATDAAGMLLWVQGDAGARRRAERMNFVEGAVWAEAVAGTNAPGTALAEGRAVQIVAAEHFNPAVWPWSCAAAPVRDPDSGQLLGAIDLTGRDDIAGPHVLRLIRATARVAEAELARALAATDEQARRAYYRQPRHSRVPAALVSLGGRVLEQTGELAAGALLALPAAGAGPGTLPDGRQVVLEPVGVAGYVVVRLVGGGAVDPAVLRLAALGRDAAIAEVDGRTLRLSPRQSEIAVALVLAAGGRTAAGLAVDLSAAEIQRVTVRAEMSRLRALLGAGVLSSQPYTLRRPVAADFTAVQALVAEGRVADALAGYPGPLLPASQAPAVVEQRGALEQQLRGAVLAAGDAGLLRRWVDAPWGADDALAWRRLADLLPGGSAPRAAAAARARALLTTTL